MLHPSPSVVGPIVPWRQVQGRRESSNRGRSERIASGARSLGTAGHLRTGRRGVLPAPHVTRLRRPGYGKNCHNGLESARYTRKGSCPPVQVESDHQTSAGAAVDSPSGPGSVDAGKLGAVGRACSSSNILPGLERVLNVVYLLRARILTKGHSTDLPPSPRLTRGRM